jgi:thiamine biosynthesis protein ThiS
MFGVNQTLTIQINGESCDVPALRNVQELVNHLGMSQDRIAVELNRRIIRRADWNATPLHDRDRIEIVQFVGGG